MSKTTRRAQAQGSPVSARASNATGLPGAWALEGARARGWRGSCGRGHTRPPPTISYGLVVCTRVPRSGLPRVFVRTLACISMQTPGGRCICTRSSLTRVKHSWRAWHACTRAEVLPLDMSKALTAHGTTTCPPRRCFCTQHLQISKDAEHLLHGARLMPLKTSKGAQREKSRAHQPISQLTVRFHGCP